MSYMALYRKYRPRRFEDVRGQGPIVTTLRNQVRAGRIGHAYLFCGTRGTGKTTLAKIFAKAVNCEDPRDGEACGECPACRAIAAGSDMNVMEINAASNNSVENIRDLQEDIAYPPTEGRYKVYIVDEVHMLSTSAFNALLKTLEEPPSYVIFVLATTEPHKIPLTILSRCQRYDFRRIPADTIESQLGDLAEKEQVKAEGKAIRYIARAADGSMRDALSLLDQCIAFYLGEELTYDRVLEVLGAVDTEVFGRMLRHILEKDVAGAISLLEEVMLQGRELSQFVLDFTWYLRNLLLLQSSDDMEDALDISSENLEQLKEAAKQADSAQIMRYIRVFSELSSQLRHIRQKRVMIEVTLIKLCRPEMEENYDSLAERVRALEEKLQSGVLPAAPAKREAAERPRLVETLPKAVPEDVREAVRKWNPIVDELPGAQRVYLRSARLSLGADGQLVVLLGDEVAYGLLSRESHKEELREAIARRVGRSVEVEIGLAGAGDAPGEEPFDLRKAVTNMEITIEDEEDT